LFGPQDARDEAHARSVLIELGHQIEKTARHVTGRSMGQWGEFGLRRPPLGSPSVEGRFSVAVAGEGQLTCSVELFAASSLQALSVGLAKWDVYVAIDVQVSPPIGDGLPRPQYHKHFSASTPGQALSRLTDAVKDLDERMMRPPLDWIVKGKVAGA
jgi:hypothetical protein